MTRTLIVFGSGPGIGNHTAAKFASKGIDHIILLSRNTQRLQNEDAPFVAQGSSSVKVDTLRIDLSDLDSIPGILKELDGRTQGEDVEVVFFNAARIKPSEPLGVDVKEIEEDFKTTNLALYIVAQHYIPKLQTLAKSNKSLKPALLVTNSHLPWDPVPQLLSLSLVKASQRNMVLSFSRAFTGSGVHIGLIHVEGVVAPENKVLNPKTIAERTVAFWEGGNGVDVNIKEE
ncbi:NAD(P)-binding protein [Cucurbitaria berberidis CBS 394.84]|uniref:NAD(P)-binding protein n=1 Tax=Cucurbitaria berberidis CBS 394.84 TaxID=1168544 RepID=A0A9P4GQY4_9PLEO|nr:NAD(P)-binding protein [Cucurbitaria berberidis CBS 394.84]KAF1850978.1 NAD(P)-binding protein [Cucurbitaria berberidis CBS 394.84]